MKTETITLEAIQKALQEKMKEMGIKKNPSDPASFGYQVASAIINGESHNGAQINSAAAEWKEFSTKIFNRWQKSEGFREEVWSPRTADEYLTVVHIGS